jgi:hypothetical protein
MVVSNRAVISWRVEYIRKRGPIKFGWTLWRQRGLSSNCGHKFLGKSDRSFTYHLRAELALPSTVLWVRILSAVEAREPYREGTGSWSWLRRRCLALGRRRAESSSRLLLTGRCTHSLTNDRIRLLPRSAFTGTYASTTWIEAAQDDRSSWISSLNTWKAGFWV